jgi:hypothetical protein
MYLTETYEEALKKIKLLKKKKYAYSTDEEFTSKDKAALASQVYKENVFDDELWDVPDLEDKNKNLCKYSLQVNTTNKY